MAMDAAKLEQLKLFISRCQSDPSILSDPSLSSFRDYLESLGAKLPASAYKTESQSKSYVVEESDEEVEHPQEEKEEEDEIVESDIEFEVETVEPDNDPP
ncbi:putative hsp70-interacting protein [Helianthus annuus]|nr:putative hsp70-interacting protein [Helianthus annuus]